MKNKFFFVLLILFLNSSMGFNAEPKNEENFDEILDLYIDAAADTALETRQKDVVASESNPWSLAFFKPTYILPYYYTFDLATNVYDPINNPTPENQPLKHAEFMSQLSFQLPLWLDIMGRGYNLNFGYTQRSFWQFYAKSQYFRETNYEPEVFISRLFNNSLNAYISLNHQSNGRGGEGPKAPERSWNRAKLGLETSLGQWVVGIEVWKLIFKSNSSDLHNPDIAKFLGHEKIHAAIRLDKVEFAATARNLERIKHSAFELTVAFKMGEKVNLFLYGFSGNGQSLIEYKNRTQSVGIGLALSNWV